MPSSKVAEELAEATFLRTWVRLQAWMCESKGALRVFRAVQPLPRLPHNSAFAAATAGPVGRKVP
jgi:hypothetical protein